MPERWLSVDPGEDTGWALWEGSTLVDAGTAKLLEIGEAVHAALFDDEFTLELTNDHLAQTFVGIEGIVCEDFRIYPWEAKKGSLNWDQVRTARLIGMLWIAARRANIWWKLQDAKIKERAIAAGAKSFFMSPLHENRHANDAIMHGVFFDATRKEEDPQP